MARRKKTPDILTEQEAKAQQPAIDDEQKQEPHKRRGRVRTPEEGQASPNPYDALFPPQPVSAPPSSLARVKLEVTAAQDLAQEVRHCMSQALNALSDLQLVQEEPDWTLIVLGAPIQPPGGERHGVALSAVATRTLSHRQKSRSPQPNLQNDSASSTLPAQSSIFKGSWLRIGALTQIQRLCEQLVSDFSRRYLTHQSTAR